MMKVGEQLSLPAGFRFHPTDDELVNHYLLKKCAGQSISVPIIAEIDLYKFDPWQLPDMALYGEKEWYFFSPRDRKYPNGSRPNRSAGTGYWKATGADKPIGRPKPLGIKKALVFYAGKAPRGIKTNWIMHEYRLANVDRSAGKRTNLRLDEWVLCRIYNKKGCIEKHLPSDDRKMTDIKYPDSEEDTKPNISSYPAQNMVWSQNQSPLMKMNNNVSQMDTLSHDSVPRLHTDSSCSDHVLSPEGQSEVKSWGVNEFDNDFEFNFSNFNYLETFRDDPFGTQAQYQMDQLYPLQDMLF